LHTCTPLGPRKTKEIYEERWRDHRSPNRKKPKKRKETTKNPNTSSNQAEEKARAITSFVSQKSQTNEVKSRRGKRQDPAEKKGEWGKNVAHVYESLAEESGTGSREERGLEGGRQGSRSGRALFRP